ncbi:MAG: hypothetical protein KJ804_00055 [Proteobacteria bacterium]|nr:hypothetical protein [Pseudomonadota bacterium]MBU1056698.1 hypothetical protein [Pseudomonadota bacterium]
MTEAKAVPGEPKVVAPAHAPVSPEEELVYDVVDWLVDSFVRMAEGMGMFLEVDDNYFITRVGKQYEVRLDPFLLHVDDEVAVNFSPLVFVCQPRRKDKLGVQILLPAKLPILRSGQGKAEISLTGQEISGVWDRSMEFFDHADLKFDEVVLRDMDSKVRLSLQQLVLGLLTTHDGKGLWHEKYQGGLKRVSFVDPGLSLAVAKIGFFSELRGDNYETYKDIKKKYLHAADTFAEMELSEARDFLAMADTYLQLFISSASRLSLEGVVLNAGDTLQLDGLEVSGQLQKNLQTNTFKMGGKAHGRGVTLMEQVNENNPRPLSVKVKQIELSDSVELNPIPPTLFTDMGAALEQVGLIEDEEAVDRYVADTSLSFARKILPLIAKSSLDVRLNDVNVTNLMEQPVTLGALALGGGFVTGSGKGGKVNVLADFSDLKGMDQGNTPTPQAARLNMSLENIPSLLNLISDPEILAAGDMEQVKGEVVMNGVSTFLTSPLLFSLTDSFLVFPTSRLNLDLTANMDNAAKYLSTGSMKMVMENPDEFMRIARECGVDGNTQQILTTISALSTRSNEKGKVVDRLNAEMNQEGKVFANNKDVTLMFFPEQADTAADSATDSGETQSPTQSN